MYQGGAELAYDMPNITRDMIVLIQGLVILFAGAMGSLFTPAVMKVITGISRPTVAEEAA